MWNEYQLRRDATGRTAVVFSCYFHCWIYAALIIDVSGRSIRLIFKGQAVQEEVVRTEVSGKPIRLIFKGQAVQAVVRYRRFGTTYPSHIQRSSSPSSS
jgi:hypothetical protein